MYVSFWSILCWGWELEGKSTIFLLLLLEKSKPFWEVRSLKMWKIADFTLEASDEVAHVMESDVKKKGSY